MSKPLSNLQTSNAAVDTNRQELLPELTSLIDGHHCIPEIDREYQLCNSNNGTPLQTQLSCSEEQIETALEASDAAFQAGHWESISVSERADYLEKIADDLAQPEAQRTMSYADALTTGTIIRTTRMMASLVPIVFRGAAHYLRTVGFDKRAPGPVGEVNHLLRPWGPALLISPWNAPTAIGSHKIASALAAGAPCIAKPSEWAPHSSIVIADAIHKASLPEGTFQLTLGDRTIGSQMSRDPRIKAVSFTGGLEGGRSVARACAHDFKPMQLELGGNNPTIVFSDADIEQAAQGIVFGLTNLNAQWCRALGRLIVHSSIKNTLLDRVLEILATVKLGDSLSEQSDMGPMIHQQQYQTVMSSIESLKSKGGSIFCSTELPALDGYFIAPTLIDGCSAEDTTDEVFGPVATIHSFETEAEALNLANGTPFGLAACVYGKDEQQAFKFASKIRTGGIKIGGNSLLSLGKGTPRAAWGWSGLGEEGNAQSIEFFTGARVVGVCRQDPLFGK